MKVIIKCKVCNTKQESLQCISKVSKLLTQYKHYLLTGDSCTVYTTCINCN